MAPPAPKLLIVDDEAPVREFLSEALKDACRELQAAGNVRDAFRLLESGTYDVVLADICMPGCSGMELLRFSQQFQWDCAIILMTGHASLDLVASSVRLAAADFLLKPFSLEDVLQSVARAHQTLLIRRLQRDEHDRLSSGLHQKTEQLEAARQNLNQARRAALESMVVTLEAREPGTYAHSFRVRSYALHVARLMNYPGHLLPRLECAAVLHDIGKIAVSDAILLKPGKLTANEFRILQTHSVTGERIVRRMGFLHEEARIIRHHHERWDGQGYPDGLRGREIPFGARLFAIADTFDAMTSDRCYRSSLGIAPAQNEIAACAGSQFDAEIAEVYLSVDPETWRILREEADASARAVIPDVRQDSVYGFSPVLPELFPATAGL